MKEYVFTLHVHQIACIIIAVLVLTLITYLLGEHHGRRSKK